MTCEFWNTNAIESIRRELRLEPRILRRVRTVFCKKFLGAEAAIAKLPAKVRERFAEQVAFHSLTLEKRVDSRIDGATKLLFRTAEGHLLESVILRAGTGRTTLCLSSQVGCAANCDFCATGKMGIAHNLTAAEMLDQVVQAGQLVLAEGRRVRNLVFMGMGEPFHNEANLYDSLATLVSPEFFDHPPSRILVSTVGIPDAMFRCARRFPDVNLALSLHSVRQSVRETLMPLVRRYTLPELRETIVELNSLQRAPLMIEYLLLAGVNDSLEDAHEVIAFLQGLRVHVNLIPYNPIDGAPHLTGTDRAGRDAFAQVLKSAGLPTTIRYSLGADIAAACGQLVRTENRRKTARDITREVEIAG
jgi:23S rRNA (adenine2503-C2)-methyltransferase